MNWDPFSKEKKRFDFYSLFLPLGQIKMEHNNGSAQKEVANDISVFQS